MIGFFRRHRFYLRPQRHGLLYVISVQDVPSQGALIVVPIPQETTHQKIIDGIQFSDSVQRNHETRFSNDYALWRATPQSTTLTVSCVVSTQPHHTTIPPQATSDQYENDVRTRMYLESSRCVDVHDPGVQKLVAQLRDDSNNVKTILKNINTYIVENLTYGDPISGLYTATDALTRDRVDCGGYDSLFVALCRASSIPAQVVSGFWAGHKRNKHDMHAWAEALLPNGQWIPADPSTEQLRKQGRSKKRGRLGFIGSDRIIFSHGSDIEIEGNGEKKTIDILQNAAVFSESLRDTVSVATHITTKRL